MQRQHPLRFRSELFFQSLLFILGCGIYVFLIANRTLPVLRTIGVFTRYNFTLLLPLLVVILLPLFTMDSRLGRTVTLVVCLWIFGLTLTGLWASGQTETSIASGLLPMSDSANYYDDALRLLEGFDVTPFTAWRPIFASLLTGILALTRQSLQAALGALVFIAGFSSFLLANRVRQSHGSLAAATLFILLFLYYRRFSGTTLSENAGFILGCLGLALLWQDRSHHSEWIAAAGLFTVSLALNARMGPFFIVPMILLWGMRRFRTTRLVSWRFAILGVTAILAAFAANLVVQRQVIHQPVVPFSNFTNIVYGIVSGGKGWTQLAADHPEIGGLTDPQKTLASLEAIRDQFSRHPEKTLVGIGKNYAIFFSKSYYNVFSFVHGENPKVAEITRLGLLALAAVGLVYGLLNRKDELAFLAALSGIGILLSVPFVSPGDAYGMRMYAAGIPEISLLPALGLFALFHPIRLLPKITAPAARFNPDFTLAAVILLTAAILFSPAVAKITSRSEKFAAFSCLDGQTAVVYRLTPGSFVRIIREDAWQLDWMPEFHHGRFLLQIHNLPEIETIDEFSKIEGEFTLVSTINLINGESLLAVAPTELLPDPPGVIHACGEWTANPEVRSNNFFYIRSLVRSSSSDQ